MSEQLPLGLRLRASARFSSFVAGPHDELYRQLQRIAEGSLHGPVYCWGADGSGKTHLLQACCYRADSAGYSAAYLPLREHRQSAAEILSGWEGFDLLCLDDLDAVAGLREWEEALFHLYNRIAAGAGRLVISAGAAQAASGVRLPDLVSRLSAALVYQLRPLDDEQCLQAMRLRARQGGFDLPEETGRYLLKRLPRNLTAMMALLERLDSASLAAQRRLTVPFVKAVLELD